MFGHQVGVPSELAAFRLVGRWLMGRIKSLNITAECPCVGTIHLR